MTCLLNQISNLEWTDKLKQFAKWWRNPVLLTMFSIMFWILINQSVTLVSENTFDTVKGLKVDWLLKWSFQQSIRTWVFNKYGFSENMGPSLQGKVCLVTGAARGIGRGWELRFLISMFPSFHKYWSLHCGWFWELTNEKSGIALQLGGAGATVYITGRTLANLEDCAKEIKVLEQRVRWTIEHCYLLYICHTANQGCATRCILAFGMWGNGERKRKWREIHSLHFFFFLHFLILFSYPPFLSIAYIKICRKVLNRALLSRIAQKLNICAMRK